MKFHIPDQLLARQCNIPENEKVTERVLELVKSPLLQGAPLKALLMYFQQLVKSSPNKYKSTARLLTEKSIYGLVHFSFSNADI